MSEQDPKSAAVDILLVDDDEDSLLLLEIALEDLGQNLVSKSSGEEALTYLLENDAAVILLDVRMPTMDGLETATRIRQRERSKHTPIIFLTGASPPAEQIAKAYALGAVDYILKSFGPEILKAKVGVFIELFRKTEALKQQNAEQEREAEKLRTALKSQELLTGWQDGSITAQIAGVGPLRARSPDEFAAMQTQYESLLDAYLEATGFGRTPPRRPISSLADQIGRLGGGPRDVIDVHLRSVTNKCRDVHPKREYAYAMEGRLLALDVMGFLVDYYRRTRSAQAFQPQTTQQLESVQ